MDWKRIAVIGALLVMSATSAHAFSNSYAASRSYSYDPNTGSKGTVYLTVSVTGTTFASGPACSYQHTPSVTVHLPNGTSVSSSGSSVNACNNMTYSNVFALDLSSIGCAIDDLSSSSCQVTTESSVRCPVMGVVFITWKDIQFERALTQAYISALLVNGMHPEAQYCSDSSSPPDFPGPNEANADLHSGQVVNIAFLWRETSYQGSFYGVPWQNTFEEIGGVGYYVKPTMWKPDCTNWDKGFRNLPLPPLAP